MGRGINSNLKQIFLKSGLWNIAQNVYYKTLKRSELKLIEADKKFYSKFLKPGDLCFDIGANVGFKSNVFLGIGARVIACEPQPYCTKVLEARFQQNSNFILVPKGVGNEAGILPLYIHEENIGATSFVEDWQLDTAKIGAPIEVELTTLDALISLYGKPDYCKIDVEGFEINVFKGLSTPLKLLSFEYHLDRGEEEIQKTIECLKYLSELYNHNMFLNVISGDGNSRFLQTDWFTLDKFINYFLNDLKENKLFQYGDIFVASQSPIL